MPEIRLWCSVQGRERPFHVTIESTALLGELKYKVNEICPLGDFGFVSLWKVRYF